MKRFLIDTYALIEWYVQGNDKYDQYFLEKNVETYVTKLSLIEFYHKVYHTLGKEKADEYYDYITSYSEMAMLTEEIIKESGVFRSEMLRKRKTLSYANCVNYVTAQRMGIKLLTGDKDFEDLKDVEFVKR